MFLVHRCIPVEVVCSLHRDCLIPPRGHPAPSSELLGNATIQAQLHGQQCRVVLEEVVCPPPLLFAGRTDQWPGERIANLA